MESVRQILGVTRYRANLVDGPLGGRVVVLLLAGGEAWPLSLCVADGGGGQHYVHEQTAPGGYVWAGSCAGHGGG